jgi:uncharacterized protein YegJ (DUF2314 family)
VALSLSSIGLPVAQAGDFKTASDAAIQSYKTKAGQQYRDRFTKAIDHAVAAAMGPCGKPGAVERVDVVFIVSADGRIVRVLSTPGIAYGDCIVSKLRLPKTVPPPPHDSWPVIISVAWNERRQGPADTPRRITDEKAILYDKAIAPYIAKARATYPAAKQRFLEGLPPGYHFSVWIRLNQTDGKTGHNRFEDVFVGVESIKNGVVSGRIDSKITLLTNHKQGERISFPESDVKNWLILRPDGVEEGNYVGKFLDHYNPQ